MTTKIEQEIFDLKKSKNALILAHYYEEGDVQDVADAVGDSLYLAQMGQKTENTLVLLCGVVFMAESVKILSPSKIVIVPDKDAGCSLVKSSPADEYRRWKETHPGSVLVSYINCSAEVKAISDVICTSSNAEKIIRAIPAEKKILFGPDKHLGNYLKRKTGRDMIIWDGSCEVHVLFSAKRLFDLKSEHPDAVVLAHPECDQAVLNLSDVVGSTSRLLKEVETNKAQKFIVATEDGIFHQMKKSRPDVELIQAPTEEQCGCNRCPYMKLNTLEKIRDALRNSNPAVSIPENIVERARLSLQRMMDITENKPVSWH